MKIIFVKGHMDKIFRETQGGLVCKCSCLKARYGVPASGQKRETGMFKG